MTFNALSTAFFVAEQPIAEQPIAEQPIAEQPIAEKPIAEKPIAEQPIVEQHVTCDTLPEPLFADMSCSNEKALDSVCEYECFLGFTLEGSSATTCIKTLKGLQWSNSPPLCRPSKFLTYYL